MTTQVRDEVTLNASQPARSTTAQRITAVAAVVIAATVVVSALGAVAVIWGTAKVVEGSFNSLSEEEGPIAIRQGLCLTYSNFVLDQHRAGLTVPQIEGVLRQAAVGNGTRAEAGDGAVIEDPDACGSPQAILDAAGIK